MTNIKRRDVFAAVTSALALSFSAGAMADSTFDLVDALVKKGVLTEEEALPLLAGRENDIKTADKKVKKAARVGISDAIDSATVYGDMRVRYEGRDGSGVSTSASGASVDSNRDRGRYKLVFGVKTESNEFYSDLAFAMGAGGRSDNATFGTTNSGNSVSDKQTLYVKRAMIGWKVADWLTLEAGRMDNPLYTTPMVWDADLQFQGLTEKFKYTTAGKTDLFFTASQVQYLGDRISYPDGGGTTTSTNELLVFQGGARFPITDNASAKAGLTYTTFTHDSTAGTFTPGSNTTVYSAISGTSSTAVNNIKTIEIPAEINMMATSNVGVRLFGDFVYNTEGDDRYEAAVRTAATADRASVSAAGNDDTAWMLGFAAGSAPDLKAFEGNKMVKGDWSARIWYQDVGAYSVDPNAVDSDFMDSRVNMKGVVLKTQYNLKDNVFVNFAAGHASRKNGSLGTSGRGDIALNLNDYNLYQLDLTYKF